MLKRKSCNNCPECEYTLEVFTTLVNEGCENFAIDNLDTFSLYRLVLTSEDDYDFIKVKN